MSEIYELWCLTGPVIYSGEIIFDNFHSFDYISRNSPEKLEELRYKLERRKEKDEGYIARSRTESRKGALNFKSCTFVPVTRTFKQGGKVKVRHSCLQSIIAQQENIRIPISCLTRVFTEAAGSLQRLIRSSRVSANQEETDSFRRVVKALRGIVEFTGCSGPDEKLEIIFRKYFISKGVPLRGTPNLTEFKLFMLEKINRALNLDFIRLKLEDLSKKGNYHKAGYRNKELEEMAKTLTKLGKYFQRGSNWAEVIIEDSPKKAK